VNARSSSSSDRLRHVGTVALHDLARRIAAHRAMDALLFEHAGAWVTVTPEPALKPVLAAWSANHAAHLDLWAARFPAVPGLDLDALQAEARRRLDETEAPLLAAATTTERLAAGADALDRFAAALSDDRRAVDQLLDAPTARVLDAVLADVRSDAAAIRAALATL
jgi:hypothetical protein